MRRIFRIENILAILSLTAVAALWHYPMTLAAIVAFFGAVYIYLNPHRHALFIYVAAGLGGAIAEVIAIYFGAWQYAEPQLFSIPLWLPFLWGNAALFIVAMAHPKDTA